MGNERRARTSFRIEGPSAPFAAPEEGDEKSVAGEIDSTPPGAAAAAPEKSGEETEEDKDEEEEDENEREAGEDIEGAG